jgi:FixJ family two-component response regulator
VQSWDQALAVVAQARHDVYLVDYRLGEGNGLQLVREAVELGSAAPFIVLTGQGNREIDLEAMRAGAADYLAKSEMTAPLLDRAIRYAIERHRAERRLAEMARPADRPRQSGPVPGLSDQDPGSRRPPSQAGGGHAARSGSFQDHQRHPRP